MSTSRMEAFSDGVIAILITIMVLELRVPHGESWSSLRPELPLLGIYVLSFTNLGIYWVNHHHLLQLADRTNGWVLWTNLHLLFWLSLLPFATEWVGLNHEQKAPLAGYGIVLLMAGFAYWCLQLAIIAEQGPDSRLAAALGRDLKGRSSVGIYAVAIAVSFLNRWISLALMISVALMWFVPDRRIEKMQYAHGGELVEHHLD